MAFRDLVDLHNHIIYGVDDGAADLEESLEMVRQFVSEGVTRVAATPHYNPDVVDDRRGPTAAVIQARVNELQLAMDAQNVSLAVLPGNELYLTTGLVELLQSGTVATLGGSKTVLVELSLMSGQKPLYLNDMIFELQLAGYGVVLAHPERYSFVERDITSLDTLIEGGILLQLTAPALLGEYGPATRRTAERLLRRGAYRLASSDRHHPGPSRSLAETHQRIAALTDVSIADVLLCQNPAAVLDGGTVVEEELVPESRTPFLARLFGRGHH